MTAIASGMLHDAFGGFVVYRNLVPADDRLPTIDQVRSKLGLERSALPRKPEPAYASVVGEILRQARNLSGITKDATRLLFVGDTMLNDVSAFSNLSAKMGWIGRAFIADESASHTREIRVLTEGQQLTVSNQWGDIAEFADEAFSDGFGCDDGTVVVVDIDKTFLGARGRNDHVIDKARQQAAYEVARDVIGEAVVDEASFNRIYNHINDPALHSLTADNQDAIAYTSLLVACGLISLEELTSSVSNGRIDGFGSFVSDMERRPSRLGTGLAKLQERVREQVMADNPTPFSDFRFAEYRCTGELMGHLSDDAPRAEMLDEEIVITEEVWMAVKAWKARGCIVFGLSDKPDEACFPQPGGVNTGEVPIHCMRTHIVGGRR